MSPGVTLLVDRNVHQPLLWSLGKALEGISGGPIYDGLRTGRA